MSHDIFNLLGESEVRQRAKHSSSTFTESICAPVAGTHFLSGVTTSAPTNLLFVNNLVFAFTPQMNCTRVHLVVTWDPCFQADQSSLVWFAPESEWAFTPYQSELHYPRKQTRVCLKWKKQLWCESDRRLQALKLNVFPHVLFRCQSVM